MKMNGFCHKKEIQFARFFCSAPFNPAKPRIEVIELNGARGAWRSKNSRGEDYFAQFTRQQQPSKAMNKSGHIQNRRRGR